MKRFVRFRDVLSDTTLYHRLMTIVDFSKNNFARGLGKNDYIHSEQVEKILDALVPSQIKQNENVFDHGEIFLLLVSVYLHDIGRRTATLQHEIAAYDEIKKFPGQYHLGRYEAEAVAQICAAHASESDWPIEKCNASYGIAELSRTGRPFNLQKLGALLRIADEIENSYVRVQGIPSERSSPRHAIRFINPIYEKGVIEIQAEPAGWDEWEELKRIKDYCQERLREVEKYLKEANLNYYQVWLQPSHACIPFKGPGSTPSLDNLIETVATLAANAYSNVELFKKIDQIEVPILCTDYKFGTSSKTAILIYKEVDRNEIKKARAALSSLIERAIVNHCIIVIAQEDIEEIAKMMPSNGCNILTFNALFRQLYDFGSSVNKQIKVYESQPIFHADLFVSLNAKRESGEAVGNIIDYITRWLHGHGPQLTLLGDFGSGKTTVCEKILHTCSIAYMSGQIDRIPILIKLREARAGSSIEALITDIIVNQLRINMNYKTFESLNRIGKFILILDGFDEMPFAISEQSIERSFRELDKLVEDNGKVILSCRTHFFKANSSLHELYKGTILYDAVSNKQGYELLFLEPLSRDVILEYLDKYTFGCGRRSLEVIDQIYNLSDLATRPVLLNIIATTLPRIEYTTHETINASKLYSLYTRFWLERDDWRSSLSIQDRRVLAINISLYFFTGQHSEIHHSELPKISKIISKNNVMVGVDVIDYELRTCNFLRRDHVGSYGFVHKSFMEYFLAIALVDELLQVRGDLSFNWLLPMEGSPPNKGTLVASAETENFVVQILTLKLNEFDSRNLYSLVKNRTRCRFILVSVVSQSNIKSLGHFFSDLLLHAGPLPYTKLITEQFVSSDDFNDLFRFMCHLIKSSTPGTFSRHNLEYSLAHLLEHLKRHIPTLHLKLEKALEKLYSNTELADSFEKDKSDSSIYPFSKSARLAAKQIIIDTTSAEDLPEALKLFNRNWARDRAEYDQKVSHFKKSPELLFEAFKEDLKRASRKR